MPTFCFTIRYLQPFSHGRGDGDEPEWPPSPLRVFQALVAAAAARWNERMRLEYAAPALQWLERREHPIIRAAAGMPSDVKCLFYVPDNTTDLLVPAWSRGEVNKSAKRTEKYIRPTHLRGGDAVHYLYDVPDSDAEFPKHRETLIAAARSITHLGWGVDMVAGNAAVLTDEEAAALPGERWRPTPAGGVPLRVPVTGTLDDLTRKHADFLTRLSADGFRPVPPLSAFRIVHYTRPGDPMPRLACVPFRILAIDPDAPNPAFDTPRRARDVAAWVRNAAGRVCDNWPDVATFVHGHDPRNTAQPARGDDAEARLLFLPLPTINPALNRIESIRRVLIAGPIPAVEKVRRVGRLLEGVELHRPGTTRPTEMLAGLGSDWVVQQYLREARTWSTVTPLILPGYDDRDPDKTNMLIRKAFSHAGLPAELIDDRADCELQWRNVGFRAGIDLATRYARPDHLVGRALHLRVRFAVPVRGPLAIGAGRYRGFGLFAPEDPP